MSKADLATIGDAVLRLSTDPAVPLASARQLELEVSGTESNVACHLSRLGHMTRWCGCLPETPLGRRATLPMREAGVDFSMTLWRDSGRVSTYFVDPATPPRDAYVIYDRKDSCFEGLKESEVDWDKLLHAKYFHATGITASLTNNTLELVETGLRKSKEKGLTTSFDVNHRDLLWSAKKAKNTLLGLFEHVDLLFCSTRDAQKLFGISGDAAEAATGLSKLSDFKWVVVSDGKRNITGLENKKLTHVDSYKAKIADRIGAGDALAAGVLYGLLTDGFENGLQYGAALAAYVLSVNGEQPELSVDDLSEIIAGNGIDIRR